MPSCVNGINVHIKRLEAIAEKCGEKKVTKEEEKDEFIRMRVRMYTLIAEVRDGVHERKAIVNRRGICHETITKGHELRTKVQELHRSLPQLQQVHKKAMGKRNASQKKEELSARYQDIRILKKHVDEVRDLLEGTNANMEDPISAGQSAQLLGLREAARGDPNTSRALDAEEEQALANMRARDEQIDKQIGEIGNVVERLGDIAGQIGVTAEQQKAQADALGTAVDKNKEEIMRQTAVTTELIKYEKNTMFCCQMVLGLLLLCIVGFIFHQLKLG